MDPPHGSAGDVSNKRADVHGEGCVKNILAKPFREGFVVVSQPGVVDEVTGADACEGDEGPYVDVRERVSRAPSIPG